MVFFLLLSNLLLYFDASFAVEPNVCIANTSFCSGSPIGLLHILRNMVGPASWHEKPKFIGGIIRQHLAFQTLRASGNVIKFIMVRIYTCWIW